MDGKFVRKKTSVFLIGLLIFGICFMGLPSIGEPMTISDSRSFRITGIGICLAASLCMLFNLGACLRVEEDAVCGRYGWFRRLNCKLDEVAFVLPQINTLTILLKNGKRHIISGIRNSYEICSAIRRQKFQPEEETPEVLRAELDQLTEARKKELLGVIGGCILLFVNIFLAVYLTGGRELHDFSKLDWMLFGIMSVAELLTAVGLFYMAGRCGKHLLLMEQLRYRLRGAVILSCPLPSNHVREVYTDCNYAGRIVVCGYPNDECVYYSLQTFDGGWDLETVDTSVIYDSLDELPSEDFAKLIDISSLVVPA